MYRLVRLIDKEIKQYESVHPEILDTLTHYHPEIEPTQRELATKGSYTYHEVLSISAGAIKNEYISGHKEEANHDIKHVYCMEPDGYRLLSHAWVYPHGLVNEILGDLGPTITFIFGLLGSGLLLLLWKLIQVIMKS
jgi:hypothetical protein